MNIGVIISIGYRIFPDEDFTELEIIPYSGNLSEVEKEIDAGRYFDTVANFNIAKSEESKDAILKTIKGRPAQYRITDANSTVYLVGNDDDPARLTYTRAIDGQPGSFNGYRCTVNCKSVNGCAFPEE